MTARGPTSFDSKSLIGVLLILVAGVTLPGTTADAEECLAAPNSPAREGTRWHYRLDWATQHKCWYMRAINQQTQRMTAPAESALPAPALATPIPTPEPSATGSALSVSRGDRIPSSYREDVAAKARGALPVSGSSSQTTLSQQASVSLAAPAPNAASLIGAATDETTSAVSEMKSSSGVDRSGARC